VVFHEPLSLDPERAGGWAHFAPWAWEHGGSLSRGNERDPLGLRARSCNRNPTSLPYGA
jgi:hypothetical protein